MRRGKDGFALLCFALLNYKLLLPRIAGKACAASGKYCTKKARVRAGGPANERATVGASGSESGLGGVKEESVCVDTGLMGCGMRVAVTGGDSAAPTLAKRTMDTKPVGQEQALAQLTSTGRGRVSTLAGPIPRGSEMTRTTPLPNCMEYGLVRPRTTTTRCSTATSVV